ncbi:copper homeostasis periplasmic binding protein CopC [Pseudomonas luteola]|uniref:copper homeostasis periplasmic binding protein CopC n=1 Tax=Pseudomonas luteola TaxID=47886 RepID=UPI003A8991D2
MKNTFAKSTLTAASLVALLTVTGNVYAHAHLKGETPAADSTSKSQKDLHLSFSEAVEARFSKLTVTSAGKPVAVKSIETDPADNKVLIVTPEQPLAAGEYKVEWHAVSVDTHKTDGSYSFKIEN